MNRLPSFSLRLHYAAAQKKPRRSGVGVLRFETGLLGRQQRRVPTAPARLDDALPGKVDALGDGREWKIRVPAGVPCVAGRVRMRREAKAGDQAAAGQGVGECRTKNPAVRGFFVRGYSSPCSPC